jgi:hypothetical protein
MMRHRTRSAVELYAGTYVPGRRAAAQLGYVDASIFVADLPIASRVARTELAEQRLLERLRRSAEQLGANAVLDVEICVDLFACSDAVSGTQLRATGSAMKLEPPYEADGVEAKALGPLGIGSAPASR